ncbi:MAG TPA: SDR family NAD(P)-dependent oxidoreductase [Amycolatopsis sp.]
MIHAGDEPGELTGDLTADVGAAVAGAENLDALLADRPLDAFVLFTTVAGVWGSAGRGTEAAVGAHLDALARRRRDRGVPALSIGWGAWAAGVSGSLTGHLSRNGVPALESGLALAALGRAMADDTDASVVVADVAWDRFAPAFTANRPSTLLDELPEARSALAPAEDAESGNQLRQKLRGLPEAGRAAEVLALVREKVAAVLGHTSADAVEADIAFKDLGFDSLTAVDLRGQLTTATGLALPATLAFDYPTPAALAAHLRAELLDEQTAVEVTVAGPRATDDDPIAIVGMSCRYPGGVRSPEDLWRLVSGEVDAIGALPGDRNWPLGELTGDGPGSTPARGGGFLYDAGDFDPGFFGISPREALVMDPQQRLVLEGAWEALERAGIDPAGLRGSDAGVFIGGGSGDYRPNAQESGQWQTAQSASLLSGRLAYTFGLEGPTVSVDTACSSSLVALHLAAQALRTGECSVAIAGGVTVMSTPANFVEFGDLGALSADGRCKAFSDRADGTGWSEGVGMLVVERLSDAQRNGHEVLAVVRGSAINSDGASNGLTAPSGPSQQRVIRKALANAGFTGTDIDAVEAHGTGTALGDPIEAQALLATYGQDRERPLLLGSVKSNIGHTQAASGVAGVIKMVLAMRHGVLPRTLHVGAPSSHVDWSSGAVELLTETVQWPDSGRARRAAVSSFGASGTNSHVIVEQAPAPAEAEPVRETGVVPVTLSGKTAAALRDQAGGLLARLRTAPEPALTDLAFSLATSRSVFEHRAAVVAGDLDELLGGLATLAEGDTSSIALRGTAGRGGKLAFLFSGQGSQQPGMGAALYRRFPVFAEAFDAVLANLEAHLDRPLRDLVFAAPATEEAELLDQTGYTQPALFAVEVALYHLVRSWGLEPDFVAGHSVGELAAAHVAGVLSLADACTLVAARGRLMQALPAGGAMVSLQASEDEVTPRLTAGASIAAVNGPRAVVIAGDEAAVTAIADRFSADGRKTRRLRVSHAFHSAHMDAMLQDFGRIARQVSYAAPVVPLVSAVTGEVAAAERVCDPGYWVDHAREAVRFADAVRTLARNGVTRFLEIGPDSVLSAMTQDSLGETDALVVPLLRKDRDEEATAVAALARLQVDGVRPAWSGFFAGTGARRVDLPTYAFQHERFWPAATAETTGGSEADSDFWAAVANEDFAELAATLNVEGDALSKVLPALMDWRRQRSEASTVDGWRHRIGWTPLSAVPTGGLTGTWLALVPEGDDEWVPAAIDALGAGVVRVDVPADQDREALAGSLSAVAGTDFAGVVSLLALSDFASGVPAGVVSTTKALQALGDAGITAPLWCVTRGAISVGLGEGPVRPDQAGVWGLGHVAALEYPERWGGLVDLPEVADAHAAEGLAAVLAGLDGEDEVAVRSSGLFGRRLRKAAAHGSAPIWEPSGTVLITGGTGALGRQLARRLARDGAEHLLLASRGGLDAPGATELRDELAATGVRVTISACDVADRAGLEAVLDSVPAEYPLTGVVHAAGVLDDGVLDGLTPDRFDAVFRSKVGSAFLLDELTRDLDLKVFALFSSASGAVGNPGQANYAAANTVLDAIAERRHSLGLAATSIAWGAWGGEGMASNTHAEEAARRTGIGAMDPELAFAALRQVVTEDEPTVLVAAVDAGRFSATARPSALLREMPGYDELVAAAAPDAGLGLRAKLADLAAGQRFETVLDLVRARAAEVLGYPDVEQVGAEKAFRDLGFDSLGAVELRNQLNAATGLSLTSTLVFDHPTPAALAEHILAGMLPGEAVPDDADEDDDLRVPLGSAEDAGPSIDAMEIDDLVQAALDGQSDRSND